MVKLDGLEPHLPLSDKLLKKLSTVHTYLWTTPHIFQKMLARMKP